MKIILIRHGSTAGNEEGRIQDQLSGSLSEEGKRQALLLGERLSSLDIDHVYASDAIRTRETAEILLSQRPPCPVHCTPLLRERHFGEFVGVLKKTLPVDTVYLEPKEGESLTELTARLLVFAEDLLAHHPKETVLLVGHGLANKALVNALRGDPVDQILTMEHFGNTSVTILEGEAIGQMRTLLFNDTTHLAVHTPNHLHPLGLLAGAHSSRVELVSWAGTSYVLKTATLEEIANERAFLHALQRAGLPALAEQTHPEVQENQILLEYVEGSPVLGDRLSRERAFAWGKLTRAMHDQTFEASFRLQSRGEREDMPWPDFLEELRQYGKDRRTKNGAQPSGDLEEVMDHLVEQLTMTPPACISLLHGDYHSNNILCHGERLVPFDKASDIFAGDPLYDLGFVLLDFLEPYVASRDEEEMAMYAAFVEGYGGLTAAEQERVETYGALLAYVRSPSPFQPHLPEVLNWLRERLPHR